MMWMKLSGQRWTLSGGQQILYLRLGYKSWHFNILSQLLVNYLKATE